MIGKLYGTVDEKAGNGIILKTSGGVGYKVFLPARSLTTITKNQELVLHIYTHVREQELTLFGFTTKEEEAVFTLLIGVSGVGPKTALTILGYGGVERLTDAVKQQDVSYVSSIPGIGKKTAQKILLELSTKFNAEFSLEKIAITEEHQTVIDALMALGFKKSEAITALEKIPHNLSIEEKITKALQQLQK